MTSPVRAAGDDAAAVAAGVGRGPAEDLAAEPHHRVVLASATRSFSGMSALSVMWMCSGQTSVQHLVMLQ